MFNKLGILKYKQYLTKGLKAEPSKTILKSSLTLLMKKSGEIDEICQVGRETCFKIQESLTKIGSVGTSDVFV